MMNIVKKKKLILLLFTIGWIALLFIRFFIDKGQILIWFGSIHNAPLNLFFQIVTMLAEELAFIFAALFFLFIRYKSSIAIGTTGLAVMLVALALKSAFAFERPYLYFKNQGIENLYSKIEGVEPYVGLTSFPSGHAMAAFALMGILSLYNKILIVDILLFIGACLVAISRIYLGHHFLEDIIFGSIIGLMISYVVFVGFEKWDNPKLEKSLRNTLKNKIEKV